MVENAMSNVGQPVSRRGACPPMRRVTVSAAPRTSAPNFGSVPSGNRMAGPETEIPAIASPNALKIGAATQRIPA